MSPVRRGKEQPIFNRLPVLRAERELRHARRLPTWRNRQRRRRLAAVVVLGDLALIAGAASFLLTATWLFFVLWFGGLVVGMGGFVLLRILTGRMTGSFSRLLD